MRRATLSVYVTYSQIVVFCNRLAAPFNEWTDQHVAQGFAWRPDSVAFRTLVDAASHHIEIAIVSSRPPLEAGVVRAIEVPFAVPESGRCEVASISDTTEIELPHGRYSLRCEFLGAGDDGVERMRLVFWENAAAQFAVVRADRELNPGDVLLTEAQAAM